MPDDKKTFLDVISTILDKSNFHKIGGSVVKVIENRFLIEQKREKIIIENKEKELGNHEIALVLFDKILDSLMALGATREECLQIAWENHMFLRQAIFEALKISTSTIDTGTEMPPAAPPKPPKPPQPPSSHPPAH